MMSNLFGKIFNQISPTRRDNQILDPGYQGEMRIEEALDVLRVPKTIRVGDLKKVFRKRHILIDEAAIDMLPEDGRAPMIADMSRLYQAYQVCAKLVWVNTPSEARRQEIIFYPATELKSILKTSLHDIKGPLGEDSPDFVYLYLLDMWHVMRKNECFVGFRTAQEKYNFMVHVRSQSDPKRATLLSKEVATYKESLLAILDYEFFDNYSVDPTSEEVEKERDVFLQHILHIEAEYMKKRTQK